MPSTSGTYNFSNTTINHLIDDAYQRIGKVPDWQSGLDIVSAIRSGNLLLSEWINKGLNLWTVELSMLGLNPGQNAYSLPSNTSDVLEVTMRTSLRQLGGTAFASSGVANNAFDGNPATACTQNAPDGNIGYDFGSNNTKSIQLVGIQSNASLDYTLNIQISNDNATWVTIYETGLQTYPDGAVIWYVIPVPTSARYYRILETGGATLNIQEIYFNTTVNDMIMSRVSRSEYISYPNKNTQGRPNLYWIDRKINPIIYLYPTPVSPYNCLFYSRVVMMQDLGALSNKAQLPQRFYEAFCAGLAVKLSLKHPDLVTDNKFAILKSEYDESFKLAAAEDTEKVPARFFGDYDGGWGEI